jgi:hypothetical protein
MFLLKPLKHHLLLQGFLLPRAEALMTFEHGAPSNPFLRLLNFDNYLFRLFILRLVQIPAALICVGYSDKVMAEVGRIALDTDSQRERLDDYLENIRLFGDSSR